MQGGAIPMAVAVLIVAILSLLFNVIQYTWRQQDRQDRADEKAEHERTEKERVAEQRRKEEAAPQFHNFGGDSGPIKITGMQHSVQGPFMDVWGIVTVVNPTNVPMKISLLRLVLGGEDSVIHSFFFRLKSNPRERFERISVRGNDKEDYEMHFMFPDNNYPTPPSRDGELWFSSDNRQEASFVKIRFS
jgi:hypothetical protein